MVFDYVVRPSIHNNNLHPIPTGANIKIKIEKNDELVVLFNYDVTRAVPRGK
jgi:hypothetical protein